MKPIKECVLSNKINEFKENSKENKVKITRMKTGFDEVDSMLGGGLTPGLTVLGAASGLGKSTFLLQLAENVSENGIPVLYFSLEMSSTMIAAKAINRQLFIQNKKNTHRKFGAMDLTNPEIVFSATTWESIERSRRKAEEKSKNLYVLDMENLSEQECTAKGIYGVVKTFVNDHEDKEKPLVIVDYLQILKADPLDNRGDRQSVENCIRWMTKIHLEFKVSVVLISSLSRTSYKQKVQQDSFKETGGIEYSSDVLLGLSFCNAPSDKLSPKKPGPKKQFSIDEEKEKVPREVELSFLKQRYGVCGVDSVVKLNYYAKYDFFEEVNKNKKEKKQIKTFENVEVSSRSVKSVDLDELPEKKRSIGSGNNPIGEDIL